MKKTILGIAVAALLLFTLSGCNKQIIDTTYTYNKAITYIGNEKIEIDIEKWNDYEGEQIQIVAKNGTIYLLSMNNTILVKEK